jgi:hypothetical protein
MPYINEAIEYLKSVQVLLGHDLVTKVKADDSLSLDDSTMSLVEGINALSNVITKLSGGGMVTTTADQQRYDDVLPTPDQRYAFGQSLLAIRVGDDEEFDEVPLSVLLEGYE